MRKILIPLVIVLGIFLGLATANSFSDMNRYASAADSQTENDSSNNQTIDATSSQDLQGISGSGDGQKQNDKNKDKIAPTILSVQPNYGTVGIPDDAKVEVTFSEPIKSSSLTVTNFKLQNSGDNSAVAGDISLSDDGTIATLTPSSPLSPSTPFTATVSTGVKDLAGNKLVSPEKWSFTTGTSSANDKADGPVSFQTDRVTSQEKAAPIIQSIDDDKLVERIFPLIVNKLDGATILSKLDATQLLQKVDGQALLEKVLPYLDIKLVGRTQDGEKFNVKVGGIGSNDVASSKASCNADETISGGGFYIIGGLPVSSYPVEGGGAKYWLLVTDSQEGDYSLQSKVQCMKVEVGIKPVGGSPLLPP